MNGWMDDWMDEWMSRCYIYIIKAIDHNMLPIQARNHICLIAHSITPTTSAFNL